MRGLGPVLVFALLAPPLATALAMLLFLVQVGQPNALIQLPLTVIAVSYPFGLIPAVLTGALLWAIDRRGRSTWLHAVLIAGVVSLAYLGAALLLSGQPATILHANLVACGMIASLVCWRLTRRMVEKPSSAGQEIHG